MQKIIVITLCAGLLFAPLLQGEENIAQLNALFQEKSPEKRLQTALKLLKSDPDCRTADQEIRLLLEESSPAQQKKIADSLLTFAETNPVPDFLTCRILEWAMQSNQSTVRCAALCRKAIEQSNPPEKGASEAVIRDYLELLDCAAYSLPFSLATDAARYQKVWELSQNLPWAKGHCVTFFSAACRLAPEERRCLGLKQSESAEYREIYQAYCDALAKGNEEERVLAMTFASLAGETKKAQAILKTLPMDENSFTELLQYQIAGDHAAAVAWCRKRIRESKEPLPPLQLRLAFMHFVHGELKEAEEAVKLAYPELPQEAGQLFCLIHLAAGKPADEIVPVAKQLTPDEAFHVHVLYLTKQGKYEEAVKHGYDYLRIHPESEKTVYSALLPPIQAGKLTDAARTLLAQMRKKGMLQDPGRANDMGYTLCTLGIEQKESAKLLEYAYQHRPLDAPTLDSMAVLRYQQGNLPEAWLLINRALRFAKLDMEPFSRSEILGHAADIALAMGKKDEALRLYREASAMPPMPFLPSPVPEWQVKINRLTGKTK